MNTSCRREGRRLRFSPFDPSSRPNSWSVTPCVPALCLRAATRAEEELSPYLPPNKRAYVFGSLAAQAARLVMWLLPELKVGRPAAARL